MDKSTCEVCGKEMEPFMLHKCPMCHKYFCEKCEQKFGGIFFCSKSCGNLFFFPDPDDVEID